MHSVPTRSLTSVASPLSALARHGSLTVELTKREILGRYRGASFGLLWSLISPFLMLAVYSFAFGGILKSRWPQANGQHGSFALILFLGLITHAFFAECINRAPSLVVGNVNYVKRVIFPLEILPWPMALFTNLIAFIVLQLALTGQLSWMIILFPLIIAPLFVLALGISWGLAALSVYFRDISQVTGVLTTALLFTSSAIVPVSAVAPEVRWIFEINPLTFIIDQVRAVALWGQLPDWSGLGLYAVAAVIVAYMGFSAFAATRRGFADVL
jgi:lipopolysaccharide transport system permease protein